MTNSKGCVRCMSPSELSAAYVLWTSDRRFGIRVNPQVSTQIASWCENSAESETGGVLIGRYVEAHRIAEVIEALPPPADSRAGRHWFFRGITGLNDRLRKMWGLGRGYYLGEWHYHPGGRAKPSGTDLAQMSSISKAEEYACPEPVLLIVGGTPRAFEIRSYVFLPEQDWLEFTAC